VFYRKINVKSGRKNLKEKLEELDSSFNAQSNLSAHSRLAGNFRLSMQFRSAYNSCLAPKRPMRNLEGKLSAKTYAKREVSMKSKLP